MVFNLPASLLTLGKINAFKKAGIKEYEILAIIDDKTCALCEENNGKHFEVQDFSIPSIGNEAPPYHPFCRCTIKPYDEAEIKKDKDWRLKGKPDFYRQHNYPDGAPPFN